MMNLSWRSPAQGTDEALPIVYNILIIRHILLIFSLRDGADKRLIAEDLEQLATILTRRPDAWRSSNPAVRLPFLSAASKSAKAAQPQIRVPVKGLDP